MQQPPIVGTRITRQWRQQIARGIDRERPTVFVVTLGYDHAKFDQPRAQTSGLRWQPQIGTHPRA